MKSKNAKLTAVLLIVTMLSMTLAVESTSALLAQNTISWFWGGDTNVVATATGNVDGDAAEEIITAGYYNDGFRWIAQLHVLDSATLAVKRVQVWYWGSDTNVAAVAIGDVDADGGAEIVTGGSFFDGTRWVAQLHIWNGSTLAVEGVQTWYWGGNTNIASVAIGDVDGDQAAEIVTGGAYFDGTRWVAQLHIWNSTLAVERVQVWYWGGNTYVSSMALANLTGTTGLQIVTGGAYLAGPTWAAQIHIWDGPTLTVQKVQAWVWGGNTDVSSLTVANLYGNASQYIVTAGSWFNGTLSNALLHVWDSSTPTLTVKNQATWTSPFGATIGSVVTGNFSGGASLDIITGGSFNDSIRNKAEIIDFDGATLVVKSSANWFVTSDTGINSVALVNTAAGKRIISGGNYFDLTRINAQMFIWS